MQEIINPDLTALREMVDINTLNISRLEGIVSQLEKRIDNLEMKYANLELSWWGVLIICTLNSAGALTNPIRN